ncbi:hypothetical protein [Clostridium saccharoperbutylacetonicum]|uniref:hypothetical protein n=1 Tax=Clostridium saccharoperbutylacetonicum TaxID=36745 RepID=UPI0039EB2F10
MRKILLTAIVTSMLLSNVAFASTKTVNTHTSKNTIASSVQKNSRIHLDTQDPY